MDRKLENKVGVIVGGTRGIGKAIALRMAELGMDIAVLARNAGELTETKKEITDLGVKCLTIQADAAIEEMLVKFAGNGDALFEAAQYYARKCDYRKAISLYEEAHEKDSRRPRFTDALMGIAVIYEIMGDYARAAEANDRIISLLRDEWGMTEGTSVETAQNERNRLLAKVQG